MNPYGAFRAPMERVMNRLVAEIEAYGRAYEAEHGEKLYEHLLYRIKSEDSMLEKMARRGLEPSVHSALREIKDAIGLRMVSLFIDDVYENAESIRRIPGCTVVTEKDYIRAAKPNGYRSYHLILDVAAEGDADPEGRIPGHFFVEVQLRTIAMDTWAALEHELKYKKDIRHPELIAQELHRCANELASCDVSMQTIRRIIREG